MKHRLYHFTYMTGIYKTETYQNNTLMQIFCIQLRQKAIELFRHYSALPRRPDDAFPERFQFFRGSSNILYRNYTRRDSMILSFNGKPQASWQRLSDIDSIVQSYSEKFGDFWHGGIKLI